MDAHIEQVLVAGQLVNDLLSNANDSMTLYVTVTSGYLLMAYLVGKDLTTLQAAIATVMYTVFALFATIAIFAYFQAAFYFGQTYGAGRVAAWPAYGIGGLFSLGILACLKFMWDVRHPKQE